MNAVQDHYAVLGVTKDSDEVVIRAAYRALMMKYHPDTNVSPAATARAAAINAAYGVLNDPGRRSAYDQARARATRTVGQGAPSARPAQSSGQQGHYAPPRPQRRPAPAVQKIAEPTSRRMIAIRVIVALAILPVMGMVAESWYGPAAAESPASREGKTETTQEIYPASTIEIPTETYGNEITMMDDAVAEPAVPEGPPDAMVRTTEEPALDYAVIESAVQDVDRSIRKGGIQAARLQSQSCSQTVASAPTWSLSDRCAAYDHAARILDAQIARARGNSESAYFKFREDGMLDLYRASGLMEYVLDKRLERIRKSAAATANQIIADAAAARKAAEDGAAEGAVPSTAVTTPSSIVQMESDTFP